VEPVVEREPSRLIAVSGAPGSGKTAVLERLRSEVTVIPEPARAILAEQRSSGGRGTWDQDVALFVRLLLERAIGDHGHATARGGTALFDRGVPDCVGYAERAGLDVTPSLEASASFRYETEVLFFEPWREIYTTDDERRMRFEDSVAFGEELRDVYLRCGYTIVDVPRGPVPERVAFVRLTIDLPG
jgi:predicted ATPase